MKRWGGVVTQRPSATDCLVRECDTTDNLQEIPILTCRSFLNLGRRKIQTRPKRNYRRRPSTGTPFVRVLQDIHLLRIVIPQ